MFKYKKLWFTLLLLVLIAVISACGGDNNNDGDTGDNNGDNNTEASGDEVYENECMQCHGDDGEGSGSNPELEGNDAASDHDEVVEQVEEGGGSMPAFEDDLSDDEIDAVADYVVNELN